MKDYKIIKAFASDEVIVSAGALNTPQILQLSGIGPAPELKRWNIDLIKVLLASHASNTVFSARILV